MGRAQNKHNRQGGFIELIIIVMAVIFVIAAFNLDAAAIVESKPYQFLLHMFISAVKFAYGIVSWIIEAFTGGRGVEEMRSIEEATTTATGFI